MSKAITTDAIFTRFSSRVDGSVGFGGVTPEMTAIEKVALMELHGKNVKLLIQPTDSVPDELVTVKSDLEHKTPSQRLRAVLFVQFRQQQEEQSFDVFYASRMNQIIEAEKSKLEKPVF